MSPGADWERVKEIVADALERPSPDREPFVDRACRGDPELRAAVLSLLRGAAGDFDSFLVKGPSPIEVEAEEADPLIGREVGGFRVVRRLGFGGSGTVYEAEQRHPHRKVALKVLHPWMQDPDTRLRFELEVEVLGRLEHPAIARIYEAGTFDDGGFERPYLVMERIDGRDLLHAAGELGFREKIELFAEICDGVQFAHTNGVVHRDLKPANLLVDDEGRPRILDFGIARLVERIPDLETPRTEAGRIVGTIAYMSPEQLACDDRAVDFRTDVYSLGVVLCELVSGGKPHDLTGLTFGAAARRVSEEEPRIAPICPKTFRHDLILVISTALAKNPEERYQSPASLGEDLRRLLRREPLSARPAGTFEMLRRLARRHRGPVAVAAGLLLALVSGLVASAIGFQRAERARLDAERLYSFLDRVLSSATPSELGRDAPLRTVLDANAAAIDREFTGRPELRQRLHATFGRTYFELGLIERSTRHLRLAADLAGDRYGWEDPRTARARLDLTEALIEAGDLDEARAELSRLGASTEDPEYTRLRRLELEAMLEHERGELEKAARLFEQAVAGFTASLGAEAPETLTARNNLAGVWSELGEDKRAEAAWRALLAARRKRLAPDHPRILVTENNLALALLRLGRAREARGILEHAVETGRRVWGPEHPQFLSALHNLGKALADCGELDRALQTVRKAEAARTKVLGRSHPDTLISRNQVATILMRRKRFREAVPILREILRDYRTNGTERKIVALVAHSNLAAALSESGRTAEARTESRRALSLAVRLLGPKHPRTLIARHNLACLLRDEGRLEEACALYRKNLGLANSARPDDPANRIHFGFALGRCLLRLGRYDEAAPLLREALDAVRRAGRAIDPTPYERALDELAARRKSR